ncbi:unnamed protein product [Lepeophtheirus salmonis]|uniref:(salmon louse) hypothetical protein n=1 Tax=Lepeophtheirus salmonis TaxID=72036 RepID=A0A7R8H309_LEPSM|nr:unnamed protein product [Lepeophtheirus salmonis]CAF2833302.1 unnamed protein product [Lepeophtheirus salmonis]
MFEREHQRHLVGDLLDGQICPYEIKRIFGICDWSIRRIRAYSESVYGVPVFLAPLFIPKKLKSMSMVLKIMSAMVFVNVGYLNKDGDIFPWMCSYLNVLLIITEFETTCSY